MKTDRDLLELAAKGAGIKLDWPGTLDEWQKDITTPYFNGKKWNPLTDDGDALRLAVDLNLCVQPACSDDYDRAYAAAYFFDDLGREVISVREAYDTGLSPLTATRRAIVRAAAAIGESMRD